MPKKASNNEPLINLQKK